MNALIWLLTSVLCFALSAGLALASEPLPSPGQGESAQPVVLDLNSAQLSQLEQLPGIGQKRAQAILDYREAHGGFHSVSQLLQIKGIGRAMLRKLRPLVTVGSQSALGRASGAANATPAARSPGTPDILRVR
jgi:comEA protein